MHLLFILFYTLHYNQSLIINCYSKKIMMPQGLIRAQDKSFQYQQLKHMNNGQNSLDKWKMISRIRTSPSVSFTKSQKNYKGNRDGPGPGAYDVNQSSLKRGFISFKGNKKIRFITQAPGPGAYNPDIEFPSKQYSFQRSTSREKQQQKPGPASYHINKRSNSISNSFSRNQNPPMDEKEKLLIPSVGKYNIESTNVSPKKIFSQMLDRAKQKKPGPGSYSFKDLRNTVVSIKFAKALRNVQMREKIPGPADYNVQITTLKTQGGVFTQSYRQRRSSDNIPGPGDYKDVPMYVTKHREGCFIIKNSRESSQEKILKNPGVGEYNIRPKTNIQGGVIGRQKKQQTKVYLAHQYDSSGDVLYKTAYQTKKDSKGDGVKDLQKAFAVTGKRTQRSSYI